MKEYTLSSIEIERYKNERFAWLYIHAVPPKRDDEDAAANFAVMLRACGCKRAVSTGDGIDIEYEFDGFSMRFAFDGIHGMVVECAYAALDSVKDVLSALCTIEYLH